jgi:hypothetical protein
LPLETNSDDFIFDKQILGQVAMLGVHIDKFRIDLPQGMLPKNEDSLLKFWPVGAVKGLSVVCYLECRPKAGSAHRFRDEALPGWRFALVA